MTKFLDKADVRDAAITYLLFRTEQVLDGRRFAYFFEEIQHALKEPYFQSFMQDKSRTIRKQSGVFVFAPRSPKRLAEIPSGAR